MNEDHTRDPSTKPPVREERRPEWRQDLNPSQSPRQSAGQVSDARVNAEWTAFHRRKRGLDLGSVNRQAPSEEGDGETEE